MIIDQLSVFSENKAGMFSEIASQLAEANIDIHTLTLADTGEFGVFRLIVDSPKKAVSVLKAGGFVATLTPVVAVKMKNDPGSLARITKIISDAGISIEYAYAFVAREIGSAFVVIRVEEQETVEKLLAEHGYTESVEV